MTYKAIKNFSNQKVSISEGEIFTRQELVDKFEGEGVLNYMFTCTDFKFCVEKIEEGKQEPKAIKPAAVEPQEQKQEVMFLVNEDIIKEKNVVFTKGEQKSYSELESVLKKEVVKLIKAKTLMEIKIQNV